jgi:hypothetical protein
VAQTRKCLTCAKRFHPHGQEDGLAKLHCKACRREISVNLKRDAEHKAAHRGLKNGWRKALLFARRNGTMIGVYPDPTVSLMEPDKLIVKRLPYGVDWSDVPVRRGAEIIKFDLDRYCPHLTRKKAKLLTKACQDLAIE